MVGGRIRSSTCHNGRPAYARLRALLQPRCSLPAASLQPPARWAAAPLPKPGGLHRQLGAGRFLRLALPSQRPPPAPSSATRARARMLADEAPPLWLSSVPPSVRSPPRTGSARSAGPPPLDPRSRLRPPARPRVGGSARADCGRVPARPPALAAALSRSALAAASRAGFRPPAAPSQPRLPAPALAGPARPAAGFRPPVAPSPPRLSAPALAGPARPARGSALPRAPAWAAPPAPTAAASRPGRLPASACRPRWLRPRPDPDSLPLPAPASALPRLPHHRAYRLPRWPALLSPRPASALPRLPHHRARRLPRWPALLAPRPALR
nr:wiskott-Aldrich syndrome protein homolog 1-like [Aegilops tauschii subsp. strangulata]